MVIGKAFDGVAITYSTWQNLMVMARGQALCISNGDTGEISKLGLKRLADEIKKVTEDPSTSIQWKKLWSATFLASETWKVMEPDFEPILKILDLVAQEAAKEMGYFWTSRLQRASISKSARNQLEKEQR